MSIFSNFIHLQNLDLLTIGVAVASIAILGFIVYLSNPKSITNQSFLIFACFTIFYGIINYISYRISGPFLSLWFLRLTIFLAVWHAFSFYRLFYVFPHEHIVFGKYYRKILIPMVIISSIINLTPLSFQKIAQLGGAGEVSRAHTGPGMALFGTLVGFLIISSIVKIFKNTLRSQGQQKEQSNFILIGTVITFSLLLTFNFILPVIFNNVSLIPLAPLFILPFIAFTAYAIIKYHLLNIKVIATEILTFSLSVAMLIEIVFSQTASAAIIRFLIFLLILGLGLLLDRSVRREVQQREQLEILSKQLAEANDKLKALDQARAEFISIASHQLRTPPSTVKWYLSSVLAGDYGKIPKTIKEILTKTEHSNNLLISLIEDILNVSRIERGTLEFLFEKADPLELAALTFEQLEPLAKEKNLILEFIKPKHPLPNIMADKEKLRQVINNLIDNAIKYTSEGKVEMSLFKEGENIRFQVKDSGKGINPKEISRIFEKYTRGKGSVHLSAGLGLGLYVAKIVISQHKGKIWAESPGEGKGSTFIFTIPINANIEHDSSVDLKEAIAKTPA